MGNDSKIFTLAFSGLFAIGLISVPNTVFANHTTNGAIFWFNVCKKIDYLIIEDCSTLVSNHDPYNQGLSSEGWRVAKCIAGGALAIYAGHPELLSLGPVVNCGGTSSGGSSGNNNGNPLGNLFEGLQGLFGK